MNKKSLDNILSLLDQEVEDALNYAMGIGVEEMVENKARKRNINI